MLNISPEYRAPDNVRMNYSSSNLYKQNFVSAGWKSVFFTLLLIPIFILGVRKIIVIIYLVGSGCGLLYRSMMNFIIPSRYNVLMNSKHILNHIFDYLWWSITGFVAIKLYSLMVGDIFLVNLLYLLATLYILSIEPIRTTARFKTITRTGKKMVNNVGKFIRSGVKKITSK